MFIPPERTVTNLRLGWGQYLGQYLNISVQNDAIAGRSARSYTDEGRFTTIINTVKAGDFVVVGPFLKYAQAFIRCFMHR